MRFSSSSSISANAFEGLTSITSVDFTNVESIDSEAFKGCTGLTTVDIKTATMDVTSFAGCTKLATISATNSTTYIVESGLVYSDNGRTLFMCPPGYTSGVISSVRSTVTTINLDYANVTYLIDLSKKNSGVEFNAIDGAVARGVAYSTLGMSINSASFSNDTFTLTYTLYEGWDPGLPDITATSGTPSVSNGRLTLAVAAGTGCTVLPMGTASLTWDELWKVDEIGGWMVSATLSADTDEYGNIADVNEFYGNVTGYSGNGTATLSQTMTYHGVVFDVTGVRTSTASSFSSLVDLTIEGNMSLSQATFANCNNLRTVVMDGIISVPAQLFRYCTGLTSVSLESCTSSGDYAFEGCISLEDVSIGSASVSIGTGAFNSTGLEMLTVGTDTRVTGNPGILVVHWDSAGLLYITGDYLIVTADGYSSLTYSSSASGDGQTSTFYKGGMAAVPVAGLDEVYLTPTSGSENNSCLVVLDSGLGMALDPVVVTAGGTLTLPTPSADGYTFLGWYDSYGFAVTSGETITSSTVLYADWQRESSSSSTPLVILAIFAAAVIATVALLVVNGRR